MLAATQLGVVPLEVRTQQEASEKLLETIRRTWPLDQSKFTPKFVTRMVGLTNGILGKLENRIAEAEADANVKTSTEVTQIAAESLAFIRDVRRVLAGFIAAARKPGDDGMVELTSLRADIPTILERALTDWRRMNRAHDFFLGWMDGVTAAEIRRNFEEIQSLVSGQPGAKPPLGLVAKIALGVGAAAVLGTGGFLVYRHVARNRPEGAAASEPFEVPVGIHQLTAGDDDAGAGAGDQVGVAKQVERLALAWNLARGK